jgi:hypothetical protein
MAAAMPLQQSVVTPHMVAPASTDHVAAAPGALPTSAPPVVQKGTCTVQPAHVVHAAAQQTQPHASDSQQPKHVHEVARSEAPSAAAQQPPNDQPLTLAHNLKRIADALAPKDAEKLLRQVALFERQQAALQRASTLQTQLLQSTRVTAEPATADDVASAQGLPNGALAGST